MTHYSLHLLPRLYLPPSSCRHQVDTDSIKAGLHAPVVHCAQPHLWCRERCMEYGGIVPFCERGIREHMGRAAGAAA